MLSLGLLSLVNLPTHKGHCLDRLYCTQPLYANVKIVSSAISTAHQMIIARCDLTFIADKHKRRSVVSIFKRNPTQDYRALCLLGDTDWSSVTTEGFVQLAFDRFYAIVLNILAIVYPRRTVTITSRDPPFMTPNIQFMLRQRNALMHTGRIERAGALTSVRC